MRISDWMTRNKLDDDAVAEKFGVHRVTASRWRRGQVRPSLEMAHIIHLETKGRVTLPDWFANGKGGA
jgi:transcriptional regulator with XRE-family HTH domain